MRRFEELGNKEEDNNYTWKLESIQKILTELANQTAGPKPEWLAITDSSECTGWTAPVTLVTVHSGGNKNK